MGTLTLRTMGAVAPILSAPTPSGTLATGTSATVGATTDQANGTFYAVVDTSANLSGVTATQIIAGQKAAGTAALGSGNTAVNSSTPSVSVSGLSASTAYAYACVQVNAGNSNVVTGTFTTASGAAATPGTQIYWDAPSNPPVAIIHYNIYRGTQAGGFAAATYLDKVGTEAPLTYNDTTAPTGTTNAYWVTSVDANGAESAASDIILKTN